MGFVNKIYKKWTGVKCHKCGHFSIRQFDNGFVKGCSIFNLLDEEDEEFKDVISLITEGKESRKFERIDTQFLLNKNSDCEFFVPQNEIQKRAIKKYKKLRKEIMNKRKNK